MKTLSNNYNTVWAKNYQNFIFKVEKIKTMDNSTFNCVYATATSLLNQSNMYLYSVCTGADKLTWKKGRVMVLAMLTLASNANISHSNLSLCVQ